jgi:hypothetical protein
MKTTFYLNSKKVTKKAAAELAGKERFERMIKEAKEDFMNDPWTELSYMVAGGILTIEFS